MMQRWSNAKVYELCSSRLHDNRVQVVFAYFFLRASVPRCVSFLARPFSNSKGYCVLAACTREKRDIPQMLCVQNALHLLFRERSQVGLVD